MMFHKLAIRGEGMHDTGMASRNTQVAVATYHIGPTMDAERNGREIFDTSSDVRPVGAGLRQG